MELEGRDMVSLIGPLEEAAIVDTWPKVEGFLKPALERDGSKLTTNDLLQQIGDGMMGLFIIRDFSNGDILAALCCDVQEYPRSIVFNIAYAGGRDLYRWANLLGEFERHAVEMGCDTLRITGRAGWGRVFPDYQEMCRVFERRIVR